MKLKEQKNYSPKLLSLLNLMLGKLFVHLSMEDGVIYPKAITNINHKLSSKATEIKLETGHLKDIAVAYREAIMVSKGQINSTFIWQTKGLIDLLKKRTKKEEEELYPLFKASFCRN